MSDKHGYNSSVICQRSKDIVVSKQAIQMSNTNLPRRTGSDIGYNFFKLLFTIMTSLKGNQAPDNSSRYIRKSYSNILK